MNDGPRVLPFGGFAPELADATVLPGATVIGRVRAGEKASIWYGAVVRADVEEIRIGDGSNVQDGAVLHADPGFPIVIGDRVTIGHAAVVHGAVVAEDCIVGMGAVLLNGARVGPGCIVAAGSVLRQGQVVPAGSLVAGSPAAVKRPVRSAETALIDQSWRHYVDLAAEHRSS